MHQPLFFTDGEFFDSEALRRETRRRLGRLPLLERAARGDSEAARALHVGYWPFVRAFEGLIDRQSLPRSPLLDRFPDRTPGQVRSILVCLAAAVREMKEEEGSHAAHWLRDARELGQALDDTDLEPVKAINELLERAATPDLPQFFSVLAGTEIIAEELSAHLVGSPAFTKLFARQRWIWGEIHLAPHHGPSHLDIDLDLARAYCRTDDEARERVTDEIEQTILRFERAALEIDARTVALESHA